MPAPTNQPGFVSFADYLNANQGSLEQERNQDLAGARGAVDKVAGDYDTLKGQAYDAGNAAGTAANPGPQTYDSTQEDWTSNDPVNGTVVHKAGHNAPNARPTAGPFDPTTLSGYQGALADAGKAKDAVAGLGEPGAGRSTWEAGLVGGTAGYQNAAHDLGARLDSFSNYLDGLQSSYKSGFDKGVAPTQVAPLGPGDTQSDPTAPNEGPYQKPRRTFGRKADENP